MSKPPPLTNDQIKKLAVLEPKLQLCVRAANLQEAKEIASEIQTMLRKTGHETRLLQSKNWLFETAMEAKSLTYAKLGFEGVIKKSSKGTRINLEATALLAICHLKSGELDKCRPLIMDAVRSISNIKSDERRKQFHKRLIERLEEESLLIGLRDENGDPLSLIEVNDAAISMIMNKNEDQILIEMGKAVPRRSIDLLAEVRETYQRTLPKPDIKYLPPPITEETKLELGKRASSALKRVAWRAVCNPESEVHKAWSQGLSVVYDKKYITGAIVASFTSFSISATMLAASAVALAIKFGVEVFCETFSPNGLMINRKDKS